MVAKVVSEQTALMGEMVVREAVKVEVKVDEPLLKAVATVVKGEEASVNGLRLTTVGALEEKAVETDSHSVVVTVPVKVVVPPTLELQVVGDKRALLQAQGQVGVTWSGVEYAPQVPLAFWALTVYR